MYTFRIVFLISKERVYLQKNVFNFKRTCLPSEKCFYFQKSVFTFRTTFLLSKERVYLQSNVFLFSSVFTFRTVFLLSKERVYRQNTNINQFTNSQADFPTNRAVAGKLVPRTVFFDTHYNFKILKTPSGLSVYDCTSHGDCRFVNRIAGSSQCNV